MFLSDILLLNFNVNIIVCAFDIPISQYFVILAHIANVNKLPAFVLYYILGSTTIGFCFLGADRNISIKYPKKIRLKCFIVVQNLVVKMSRMHSFNI